LIERARDAGGGGRIAFRSVERRPARRVSGSGDHPNCSSAGTAWRLDHRIGPPEVKSSRPRWPIGSNARDSSGTRPLCGSEGTVSVSAFPKERGRMCGPLRDRGLTVRIEELVDGFTCSTHTVTKTVLRPSSIGCCEQLHALGRTSMIQRRSKTR